MQSHEIAGIDRSLSPAKTTSGFAAIFRGDDQHWDGVPRINIYLLRLLFLLMLVFLGKDSWTHILTFKGTWDPMAGVAWSLWATYSVLSIIGLINPLKMLPIVLLEILYKLIWLILVAYPLWSSNRLIGSAAENMTYAFLWVVLPILVMPWRYVFRRYISGVRQGK
jgi:hypothetical protein